MLNIQVYNRDFTIYSLTEKSFDVHRKAVLMQAAITGVNTKICLTHELFEFKYCVKTHRYIHKYKIDRYKVLHIFFIFVSTNFQSKTQSTQNN